MGAETRTVHEGRLAGSGRAERNRQAVILKPPRVVFTGTPSARTRGQLDK